MDTRERQEHRPQSRERQRSSGHSTSGRSRTRSTAEQSARRTAERQRSQQTRRRTPPQKKKKKNQRKKIAYGRIFDRRFVVRLITALALVAAVILCCIVFFRVNTISVTGNETYTTEQIAEASGIADGDALLLVNKNAAAAGIMAQLPYVDQVRIGTSFPNAVRIEVVELDTAYAVAASDGAYWLINCEGRAVETVTGKEASEYLTVEGFMVEPAQAGQTITASREEPVASAEPENEAQTPENEASEEDAVPVDESKPKERLETALEILQCLENYGGSAGITLVDVSSLYDIKIWYGTQYQVNLGDDKDLAYKVEYMLAAVSQLNEYEAGVLDLTFQEEKVARFVPWSNE